MKARTWFAAVAAWIISASPAAADTTPVTILDPNLEVTTFVSSGLIQPIGIVFIGLNDVLVLEKASGQVKRVINSVLQPAPVPTWQSTPTRSAAC